MESKSDLLTFQLLLAFAGAQTLKMQAIIQDSKCIVKTGHVTCINEEKFSYDVIYNIKFNFVA